MPYDPVSGMLNNAMSQWNNRNVPSANDYSQIIEQLQGLFGQAGDIYDPAAFERMKSAFLTGGTRAINANVSAANRAAGSSAAATGMYGSAPMNATVQQNYDMGTNAFADLYGQVPQMEMAFNDKEMDALRTQLGILGAQGGFMGQQFGEQLNAFQAGQYGMPTYSDFINAFIQLQALNQPY